MVRHHWTVIVPSSKARQLGTAQESRDLLGTGRSAARSSTEAPAQKLFRGYFITIHLNHTISSRRREQGDRAFFFSSPAGREENARALTPAATLRVMTRIIGRGTMETFSLEAVHQTNETTGQNILFKEGTSRRKRRSTFLEATFFAFNGTEELLGTGNLLVW